MRDNPELAILSLPFAVGCQYAHTPRNLDSLQRSHKPASQHHGVTAYHSLHDLQHSAFVTKWVSSRDRHTTGIVVPFGIRGLRQRRFTTVEQCHCTKGQQRCRFLYTYIHTYRYIYIYIYICRPTAGQQRWQNRRFATGKNDALKGSINASKLPFRQPDVDSDDSRQAKLT